MSIIYTYPTITGNINDNVLVSDSTNNNSTSQVSISRIKDLIDVVDTLNGLTGSVSIIPGNFMAVTTSGNDISISAELGGSGTAGTYPVFTNSNTIGDGLIKNFTGSAGDITIPRFIRHEGDSSAVFGFNNEDDFIINVNAGVDQVRVRQNSISIQTDSGAKFLAGPTSASLYNDENGSTTVSKQSLTTYDSGIIVKGGTENSFARGGAVRFYTSTNNGYVGISGPTTTGTSYQIILPNSIGAVGQVLAIASIDGSNAVMEWADNGSVDPNQLKVDSMVPYGETASKNDGAVSITVDGGTPDYDVQIEHSVSSVSFLINGSNNQTIFNFGTQAGGSSNTNLIPGTWKVLGGDSSNPQKLFEPLNKTFVITEAPSPGCNITTSSVTTSTSGPNEADGSVSITISNGTPNYNLTVTHTDGTQQSVVGFVGSPVTIDDSLKAGTWTITGTDNEPSGDEKCPITGSFVITDGAAGESFFADGASPEADSAAPTADSD